MYAIRTETSLWQSLIQHLMFHFVRKFLVSTLIERIVAIGLFLPLLFPPRYVDGGLNRRGVMYSYYFHDSALKFIMDNDS